MSPSKPDESMIPACATEELVFQFDNLFHVLGVTIRRVSRKQWGSGETPFQTPARQACHILWACESYATGDWGRFQNRFGINAYSLDAEIPPDQLPTPEQILAYLEEVQGEVRARLGSYTDNALLDRTPNWGWRERGLTLLGHIIYVLRHATLHLGQLQAELYRRGIQGGVFR